VPHSKGRRTGRARGRRATGRTGEARAGISLNGVLALVCAVGLALVQDGLLAAAAESSRDTVRILVWVTIVVLLVVGMREVLGRGMRRGIPVIVGRGGHPVRRAPREGLLYLGLMAALLMGSFLGGDNLLMLVVALMIGPWLLNAWASGTLLWRCDVRRVAPLRAMAGEVVSVELQVENRKRFLPCWLALASDQVENDGERLEARVLFARVPGGDSRSGYYRIRPGRRGRYQLGPIELSTRFPLGLVERGLVFHRPQEIRVYPRLGRVASWWWEDRVGAAAEVAMRARGRGGADDQLQGLREFRSGDSIRSIHWRTTARRGDLMVREFEQHRQPDLDLVLDLWQPGRPAETDLQRVELAVSIAATLCVETIRQAGEASVRLRIVGAAETEVVVDAGTRGVWEVLDLLATARAGQRPFSHGAGEITQSRRARGVVVTTRCQTGMDSRSGEDVLAGRTVVVADPKCLPEWFWVEES